MSRDQESGALDTVAEVGRMLNGLRKRLTPDT